MDFFVYLLSVEENYSKLPHLSLFVVDVAMYLTIYLIRLSWNEGLQIPWMLISTNCYISFSVPFNLFCLRQKLSSYHVLRLPYLFLSANVESMAPFHHITAKSRRRHTSRPDILR